MVVIQSTQFGYIVKLFTFALRGVQKEDRVMFRRTLLSFAAALLLALPALAQENDAPLAYDGFQMNFPTALAQGVNLWNFAADPVDLFYPGGPQPAHTQFMFYSGEEVPNYPFMAPFAVHLYRLDAVEGYEFVQQQVADLRALLAERPDLSPYMVGLGVERNIVLPYLPPLNAAQAIRARAQYMETAGFEGIAYVTVYRQDVSPFVGREFFYTFQGLSRDGKFYIGATVWLNTELFPAEIGDLDYEAFIPVYQEYLEESIATLNAGSASDFTPSLDTMDAIFASFDTAR